ncbi:MAG: LicD family protein [Prevotella sp.]|nr:LicD family protein [Prevotella sp.]
MATYDIRPLQLRMLQTMKVLDKVFREHNIAYGIFNGSLLGAVRHHGFIPWDDDMDIYIPRPDYERFITHCREWLPEQYEFVCSENDPNYPLPFGKVQDASTTLIERLHLSYLGGIYVDVFPLDAVPSNRVLRAIHFVRYRLLYQALYWIHRDPYRHGRGPRSWMPLLIRKVTTMQAIQRSIRRLLLRYNYNKAVLAADYSEGPKGAMPKEMYETCEPYTFEDSLLMGIKDYDFYLTRIYGDYMKIPDGEHQKQHNFHVLDLEHSYKEYKQ